MEVALDLCIISRHGIHGGLSSWVLSAVHNDDVWFVSKRDKFQKKTEPVCSEDQSEVNNVFLSFCFKFNLKNKFFVEKFIINTL